MKSQYDLPEQKRRRFSEYVSKRSDLLEAIARDVLDSGGGQKTLDEAIRKAFDKMMR